MNLLAQEKTVRPSFSDNLFHHFSLAIAFTPPNYFSFFLSIHLFVIVYRFYKTFICIILIYKLYKFIMQIAYYVLDILL